MAASPINVYDHCIALDREKKKIECKYCKKVVSGLHRLKQHLAGGNKDVKSCERVPPSVNVLMEKLLFEKKRGNLTNEIGDLLHSDLPYERSATVKQKKLKTTEQTPSSASENYARIKPELVAEGVLPQQASISNELAGRQTAVKSKEGENLSLRQAQKNIGKFFYEVGLDFSVAKSLTFEKMLNSILNCPQVVKEIPTCSELRGLILQDVKDIRNSWASTGCTILLDGWVDEKGRDLLNILVDCQKGPIYLRSSDISVSVDGINPLPSLIYEVLEEVGVENVVQIVAHSTSTRLEKMGALLFGKYKSLFWAVSASHCLELILEKIGKMGHIKSVLEKANTITTFIHSHAQVVSLMRNFTDSHDLVKPSRFKLAIPFLTLENIALEKENLESMFSSSEWETSIWASSNEGKMVVDLVEEPSFWNEANMVCKGTIPLVSVLSLINEADKPQMGYIYETMDQAKETIQRELKGKKAQFMPFWEVIDEIWNKHLHCPLHAAGYYLNPNLFYSSDFCIDKEVASGLLSCVVRMAQDNHIQDKVSLQMDEYREARGAFKQGSTVGLRNNVPPVLWWSKYGAEYPELQRFAIRILSQTCNGAERYGLKRTLAEKLLTKGRSLIEQLQLNDFTFLNYNLHLQQFEPARDGAIEHGEIDLTDNWDMDVDQGAD